MELKEKIRDYVILMLGKPIVKIELNSENQ